MKVTRVIHRVWTEMEEARKRHPEFKLLKHHVGKYQYIYESNKGKISLILLPDYFMDGIDFYEIYELEHTGINPLFDDVERYRTKKAAVKRIKELLE